jgi:hypothetical protein
MNVTRQINMKPSFEWDLLERVTVAGPDGSGRRRHRANPSAARLGDSKLLVAYKEASDHWITSDGVVRLCRSIDGGHTAVCDLSEFVNRAIEAHYDPPWILNEARLELAPCLFHPGKIICVGLNYRRHAAESRMPEPTTPVLFSKFSNTLPPGVSQSRCQGAQLNATMRSRPVTKKGKDHSMSNIS